MAKAKKEKNNEVETPDSKDMVDFTANLISALNKERGETIAYNLSIDESPTHVKRWLSTGIKSLDYICSNRKNGGLPEGRIIEIFGPPQIGKSHIAAQICRMAQLNGGIAVYIDSETSTSVENLQNLGINVRKGFVYVNEHCTEHIMAIAESTILKTRALKKDVPVVIVWDSVAASSPKQELEGDYDKDTMGLQARVIAKGMRKITGVIGNQNVLFVILNQQKTKIGFVMGDPTFVPGGASIPYHASVRIKLGAGQHIENDQKEVIGINVSAKTIKNRMCAPFRKVDFQIHFGVGIKEHEELFDIFNSHGAETINNLTHIVCGYGAWKYYKVYDPKDPENANLKDVEKPVKCIVDEAFYKPAFDKILKDPRYAGDLEELLSRAMIRVLAQPPDIDHESYIEMQALAQELGDQLGDIAPE